ncbi:MAG: hypothetical protein FJ128_07225 [Deltaproteobacteria bacterium]|nr:hypothetical protein [Deltaproteobacteria bacterium]
MKCVDRLRPWLTMVLLAHLAACGPFPGPPPPLTVAAARQTLEEWNPVYVKVVEFYGLHYPGQGEVRLAYAAIINPTQAQPKPLVYEARFQLLTRPDGRRQWFLTSLITHSAGLSRRQGWDNILVPVKGEGAKPGS